MQEERFAVCLIWWICCWNKHWKIIEQPVIIKKDNQKQS